MLSTIDRYVLSQTMRPMAVAAGIGLVALILAHSVEMTGLVADHGSPLYVVLSMLANQVPAYLGLALPVAFFVGVLFAFTRFARDSELGAIHVAGVGLPRLLLPFLGPALLLVVINYALIGYLQPYALYSYRTLVHLATESVWNMSVEQSAFFTGHDGVTFMADGVSDGGRRLTGIFLHEEARTGRVETTITAERGRVYRSADGRHLILSLERGLRVADIGSTERQVMRFERLELPLELTAGILPFRPRGGSIRELTLSELWRVAQNPEGEKRISTVRADLNERLVRILTPLFIPLLAIGIGTSGRRSARTAAFVVGVALMVIYHHLIELGEGLVEREVLSPIMALWGLFLFYCGASAWLFCAAAKRVGGTSLEAVLDRLVPMVRRLGRLGAGPPFKAAKAASPEWT